MISAQTDAESMASRAQARFAGVQTEFVTTAAGIDLLLTFGVSAEKWFSNWKTVYKFLCSTFSG